MSDFNSYYEIALAPINLIADNIIEHFNDTSYIVETLIGNEEVKPPIKIMNISTYEVRYKNIDIYIYDNHFCIYIVIRKSDIDKIDVNLLKKYNIYWRITYNEDEYCLELFKNSHDKLPILKEIMSHFL